MLDKIKGFSGSEVEIEYLLTGEENEEAIMFVHGVGADLRQFLDQHKCFSKDYKVLSISLRGHGKSGNPINPDVKKYTIEKHGRDILEVLAYLKIDSIHYVGNSAGGLIGFELIKSNPELFKSITTFGTTAELKYSNFTTNLLAGINRVMTKVNPLGYKRLISKKSSKYKDAQMQIYNGLMLSSGLATTNLLKNIGNYSFLSIIENMHIPYLLIQGEEDNDINNNLQSTLKAIQDKNNASIVKMKEAGHFINLDKPDEFNEVLESFIRKISII